tara:strand:- start:1338 stop:1613 length:276 start_codon:yes stop_codon:yes gene_type:complete
MTEKNNLAIVDLDKVKEWSTDYSSTFISMLEELPMQDGRMSLASALKTLSETVYQSFLSLEKGNSEQVNGLGLACLAALCACAKSIEEESR